MANHSSILARKIPWTEELGQLYSTGSQSDMTEWLTHTHTHYNMTWRPVHCPKDNREDKNFEPISTGYTALTYSFPDLDEPVVPCPVLTVVS